MPFQFQPLELLLIQLLHLLDRLLNERSHLCILCHKRLNFHQHLNRILDRRLLKHRHIVVGSLQFQLTTKNEIGNPFWGSLSHFFVGAILQQPPL